MFLMLDTISVLSFLLKYSNSKGNFTNVTIETNVFSLERNENQSEKSVKDFCQKKKFFSFSFLVVICKTYTTAKMSAK